MVTDQADLLLREFAACSDSDRAAALLETLVAGHMTPSVRETVSHKLAIQGAAKTEHVEEVSARVAAEMAARLLTMKEAGEIPPGALAAHTAAVASRACNDFLRRTCPNRHRLQTRLRYLMAHEKDLAVWEDADSEWLCGYARWQAEKTPPVPRQRLDCWRDILQDVPSGPGAAHPADLALAIFDRFGAPLPLDGLVAIVAVLWAVEDSPSSPDAIARELSSGGSDPAARADLRNWIGALWNQARELPLAERTALLLGLRAATGTAALALLPPAGVASVRQIAGLLELPADEFAGLWNRLPLEDTEIAERLGVPVERVVILRNAARERLTRTPIRP